MKTPKQLISLLILLHLAACGGGSGANVDNAESEQSTPGSNNNSQTGNSDEGGGLGGFQTTGKSQINAAPVFSQDIEPENRLNPKSVDQPSGVSDIAPL